MKQHVTSEIKLKSSLLAEVSHDEAKMRKSLSFLSFLPRRERPLLAGKLKSSAGKFSTKFS